jgi:hypothetical protein
LASPGIGLVEKMTPPQCSQKTVEGILALAGFFSFPTNSNGTFYPNPQCPDQIGLIF